MHRNKREKDMNKGMWIGLGGKFEKGESPEECALREVYEESGLTMRNPVLRGFLTFPDFDGAHDWQVFLFSCTDFHGELRDPDEGTLRWVDDSELKMLPMWEGDYLFLDWMTRGPFFTAKFIYRSGRLDDFRVTFY